MPGTARPLAYFYALLLALLALGIRAGLQPWLGSMQPFASGFVSVAAAVLWFGWRPAVLSAVVSFVGANLLLLPNGGPIALLRPQGLAAAAVYAVSAGLIIAMGHRARIAEQRLAAANEELRAADRKKDEFLATLSHELRNPIGVIGAAVSLLEPGEENPQRRSTLALLSRQVALIRRLVDDLLDVGRITRGRLTLHPSVVDVRTCVEQAVESNRHATSRKKQSIEVQMPTAPVDLHADHARLVQVVSNLIDNASKYSPELATVTVLLADGEVVTIEVTDNGPGIAPDVLPHVFEMFDQGASSESEGLGLGLGLCKRIVEMHGGSIAALPNPRGQGACFEIRLPRTRGASA